MRHPARAVNIGYGPDAFSLGHISNNQDLTDEQINVFQKHLQEEILANNSTSIWVDYDPCPEIQAAMNMAGISQYPLRLPLKTFSYTSSLTYMDANGLGDMEQSLR